MDSEGALPNRLQATVQQSGTHYIQLTTVAAANGDYRLEIQHSRESQVTTTIAGRPTGTTTRASPTTSNETTTTGTNGTASTSSGDTARRSGSGDDWPDNCTAEAPVLKPGQYAGSLSPRDWDMFRVNMTDGEFVAVRFSFGTNAEVVIVSPDAIAFTAVDGAPRGQIPNERDRFLQDDKFGGDATVLSLDSRNASSRNSSFRIYAEETGTLCIGISSYEGAAGQWRLAFARNASEPPVLDAQADNRTDVGHSAIGVP